MSAESSPCMEASQPLCPVQDACGGCPLMPLGAREQEEKKLKHVLSALELRGVTFEHAANFRRAGTSLNYRNRLRLKVHPDGVVGFFNTDKDAGCAVVTPSVRALLQEITECSLAEPSWMAGVDYLEVRGEDSDGYTALAVYPSTGESIDRDRLTQRLGSSVRVEIPPLELGHGDTQRFDVYEDVYVRVPIGSFMQVNHAVNRALIQHVVQTISDWNVSSFLDLYCGAGNYSMPLAASGLVGHGIEVSTPSISAAKQSASEQGLSSLTFQEEDAESAVKRLYELGDQFDVVVANPPRSGLKQVAKHVAQLASRGLILCSCDAQAFARDLAIFTQMGWSIDGIEVFDMFPHTRHVECCAWLTKPDG